MKELNFDLLKSLYCVFSPSDEEKRMRRFIKKHIKNTVPSAIVTQDEYGNLFVTKGEAESYPCLCAHMDQVQHLQPKDFVCVESQGVIFGYSPKVRKQCGLGADDKNGIFIALQCLERYDVLKCAFFVGEEIGCVGSSAADISFFSDCRFCAQIDRRGNSDMVTSISYDSICSEDFIKDADCTSYGYVVSTGFMTDVEALRRNGVTVSCINMSCGYYEPHTDHEFTVIEDVQKEIEKRTIKKRDTTMTKAINSVNRYLYKGYEGHSWSTQVLPIINTEEDVYTLNTFVMDCLRAVKTGKRKIGGIGFVKNQQVGCIQRGRGRNVTANRGKTAPIITGYLTLGCARKALLTSKAAYDTLVANL